jgi:SAM-dependent methyltransferase
MAATPPSYGADFYRELEPGVWQSASTTAGLLCELFAPGSVVDVGCGTGIWLAALRNEGVSDILGVDGPWVPREILAVPEDDFLAHDLTAPLALDRRFDLALCLETAEHLPPEAAGGLVDSLVGLAPVVVFSAAVPGQGGHGHVNEQWPSYWRDLFAAHGYRASSVLRNRLWSREEVEPWYRQNLHCFAAKEQAERLAPVFAPAADDHPVDVVHPAVLCYVRDELAVKTQEAERLQQERDAAQAQLDATLLKLHRIKTSRPYRLYSGLRRLARQK